MSARERHIRYVRSLMQNFDGVQEGRVSALRFLRQASSDAYALENDEKASILRDIVTALSGSRDEYDPYEDKKNRAGFAAFHNTLINLSEQSDEEFDQECAINSNRSF